MVALAAVLLAACPHPYMPLATGESWTYRLADGAEIVLSVEEVVTGDGWSSARVASTIGTSGTGVFTTFTCGEEGLVLPFGSAILAGRATVEVLEETGVSLPADAKPGATWDSTRVIRVKPSVMALASKHRIAGAERLKTPAGAFDAIKVEVATVASSVKGAPPERHHTTLWFARGVGLVKMDGEAELVLVRRGKR